MTGTQTALSAALVHHQAGRLTEAEAGYRELLGADPEQPDALHLLGVLAHQVGRHEDAVMLIGRAIALSPAFADFHANLANVLWTLGRAAAAEASCRRALALDDASPLAHNNLGNALAAQGRLDEARASYERALALAPSYPEGHNNLGGVLQAQDRLAEAEACFRRALALAPDFADALTNLGVVLRGQGRADEAIACYERALAINPRSADAYNNLGNVLIDRNRHDEAVEICRRALALRPDFAEAWDCRGNALLALGQIPEAIASYRRAVALKPASAEAHSDLIFALDFEPTVTAAEAFAERRRWNATHALPLGRHGAPHANDPTPDRRLRIGYVSADFRDHSAARVFGPVVLAHDPEGFEVVCYAGRRGPEDAVTARFREAATLWRPTSGVPDLALTRQIRQDAIDVLVDLSGHTGGHRLKVFASRPAPVQVTAWGHALGTGLDAMDYFFADAVTVPPEARPHFSEEVVELPAFVPYSPPAPSPDVTVLPALGRGTVTFGCFNRLAKVTPEALALWATILGSVPGARLLMKFHGLEQGSVQERIRSVFAEHGVDGARIEFMGGSKPWEHLAAYGGVDLALDPSPHGGGVTALDGLWMGVPMVTRVGERIPSRMGASMLTTLGLEELIARTPDEYVAAAIRQARDLPRLAALRAGLRERLATSIICDHRAYCRAVEEAYRAMWRRWCASRATAGGAASRGER